MREFYLLMGMQAFRLQALGLGFRQEDERRVDVGFHRLLEY
jgi:hypothetical protein